MRLAVTAARSFVPALQPAIAWAAFQSLALVVATLPAAEPAAWLTNRAQAAELARKQGRLLLVVHVSGDFATSAGDCQEAQLYRKLLLGDARVAAALSGRFVIACQLMGEPKALPRWPSQSQGGVRQDSASGEAVLRRPTEMAIAYICLPDERVLHFVPGFVSAAELLAELEWVETTYSQLIKASEADMAATLRSAHLGAIVVQDGEALTSQIPTRWSANSPPPDYSTVDLPHWLAAARAVWDWSQRQRLGAAGGPLNLRDRARRRPGPVARSTTLSALAAHGRLGPDFAHLVLSEFPLAYLSDLAEPAYEACTGERCWHVSPRRSQLAAWYASCAKHGRRTLLIVSVEAPQPEWIVTGQPEGDPPQQDQPAGDAATRWPDEKAIELAALWRVAAQVVTIDELATLLTDAALPPLAYDPVVGPPRFVLHDARGVRCGELAAKDATSERLTTMLRIAVAGAGRQPPIPKTESEKAGLLGPVSGVQNEGDSDAKP